MSMYENIGVRGFVNLKLMRDGRVVYEVDDHNTILTMGKAEIARGLVADISTGSKVDWMALGLGSSTISATDLTLGSEYLRYGLGSITGSTITTTTTNDTAQWIGSFTIDATKTINEAGLFNASGLNSGSMIARTCFTDIVAGSQDTILATWRIQFS